MSSITTASGPTIEDTVIGEGAAARPAGTSSCTTPAGSPTGHNSIRAGKTGPLSFTLGKKEVMAAGKRGCAHESRRHSQLTIRRSRYGEDGADTIPRSHAHLRSGAARGFLNAVTCAGKSSGRQDAERQRAPREIHSASLVTRNPRELERGLQELLIVRSRTRAGAARSASETAESILARQAPAQDRQGPVPRHRACVLAKIVPERPSSPPRRRAMKTPRFCFDPAR